MQSKLNNIITLKYIDNTHTRDIVDTNTIITLKKKNIFIFMDF